MAMATLTRDDFFSLYKLCGVCLHHSAGLQEIHNSGSLPTRSIAVMAEGFVS
jgi:hypothetical protein